MQRTLTIVLATALALVVLSVVVFMIALDLSLLDAVYFAVTTVTTVGYGDITLKDAPAPAKLFGIAIMVAGPAAMAAGFGILTDALLRHRLAFLKGTKRQPMKDHIVLCGVGNVGVRVLEQCVALGEPVVAVERDEDQRFLSKVRSLGVPVVVGDMRAAEVMAKADVAHAKSVIACTQDDLANLEAGLLARAEQPRIRVVLRMFNQNLARRLEDTLGVTTALSTSTIAAPAFAMAALDDGVIGSFELDGELWLTLRTVVGPGHPWLGGSVAEAATAANGTVLLVERVDGTRLRPPDAQSMVEPGDRIVVCVAAAHRDRVPG
ncbi:MAG: NAD-binding protein [Myxococcota bacterium]